ncbi:MAG: peroxiredoxin family protein [Planctomycetota bacterium]
MVKRDARKQILIGLSLAFLLFTGFFLVGCEKKSGEPKVAEPTNKVPAVAVVAQPNTNVQTPNEPVTPNPEAPVETKEPNNPPQKQVEPVVSDGPRLIDVVRSARTWQPAYINWYGRTAPDFTLTDTSGKEHKLSDYRGKNVMLVFWATWCGPCKLEIPHLVELRKTASEDSLAILAISRENPALVKSFAVGWKLNYTVLHDTGGLLVPYSTVASIPSSFFIDPDGKIKLATAGLLRLNDMKAILQGR